MPMDTCRNGLDKFKEIKRNNISKTSLLIVYLAVNVELLSMFRSQKQRKQRVLFWCLLSKEN